MKCFWLVAGSTSMLLALVIAAATGHATETGTEAGAAFLGGILLFPCGIYASRIFGINEIRPLIPVGGAAFMLGWLLLAAAALRLRSS